MSSLKLGAGDRAQRRRPAATRGARDDHVAAAGEIEDHGLASLPGWDISKPERSGRHELTPNQHAPLHDGDLVSLGRWTVLTIRLE
jgi:hypothetical protein